VNNKRYQGDRYRYGQMGTGDRSAHRIVASYPAGRQVEVDHAPNNPADAVLYAGLLIKYMSPMLGHSFEAYPATTTLRGTGESLSVSRAIQSPCSSANGRRGTPPQSLQSPCFLTY
jgi:hypothetical protein